jgi:hypothetical protein
MNIAYTVYLCSSSNLNYVWAPWFTSFFHGAIFYYLENQSINGTGLEKPAAVDLSPCDGYAVMPGNLINKVILIFLDFISTIQLS